MMAEKTANKDAADEVPQTGNDNNGGKVRAEISKFELELDNIESRLKPAELVVAGDDGIVGTSLQISRRKIGEILVDNQDLRAADVSKILKEQEKNPSLLFGEIATNLGLIRRSALINALNIQFGYHCQDAQIAKRHDELVAINRPFGREAEALRSLRTQLLLQLNDQVQKPIVIVSPGQGEGRSFLAANLAVVLAQLGKQTLLVDADLRCPKQHQIFELPKDTGLSIALSGRASECLPHQIPITPFLFVMTAGPPPPNPQELLSQSAFSMLLKQASEHFDYVVVDTPAASVYADAEITAAQAGAALVVARKDQTSYKRLQDLSTRLEGRAEILGCVLNAVA